jgi:hypothetical protein
VRLEEREIEGSPAGLGSLEFGVQLEILVRPGHLEHLDKLASSATPVLQDRPDLVLKGRLERRVRQDLLDLLGCKAVLELADRLVPLGSRESLVIQVRRASQDLQVQLVKRGSQVDQPFLNNHISAAAAAAAIAE